MQYQFIFKCFRIICLLVTGALFLRGGLKYLEDKNNTEIEYRTFQETHLDIYPTLTLCVWNDVFKMTFGLYDREKLNKTYKVKDPLEYMKFLDGIIWDDEMVGVDYDDVTLDIKDRVESIVIIGDKWKELYSWHMSTNNANQSTKSSHSPSYSTNGFPFYTSYRHAWGKCFSLDLTVDQIPQLQENLINVIMIKFKNIRIPNVNLHYIISYPGQILQGLTIDLEFAWSQRITSGFLKAKLFLIDIIEVFRRRNTFHESCNENSKEYDNTVMENLIKTANCTPPHWNISSDYTICDNKEDMRKVSIPGSAGKTSSTAFLKKFLRPCDGILSATLNRVSERRQITFGGLIPTAGVNSASVGFLFKNDRYKEIKYTRKFDIESLIGNVGGYIGLFLGFAIWQLPDAIDFLITKLRTLQGG